MKNTKNLSMEWIWVGVGIRFNSLLLHSFIWIYFFSPFHLRLELVHTSLGVCACAVKHDLPVCTLPTTIVRIKIANMEHGIVFFANFGYLNGFHILPHSTLHLNTSTFNPKKKKFEEIIQKPQKQWIDSNDTIRMWYFPMICSTHLRDTPAHKSV